MQVLPASLLSKSRYRSFCEVETELPIFVKDWYLDAVCEGGEWEVILVENNENIIASFPYFIKKKMGFCYITMPHFTKWMGCYIRASYRSPKLEHKILSLLLSHFPIVDAFKQNFHPNGIQNWSLLYWNKFKQTTKYTYCIDLRQSLEEIRKNTNRNIRRNINKAERLLTVKQDLDAKQFYQISKMSFDRQNIAVPYSLTLFLEHYQVLKERKCGKIFYAIDESNNIHAVSFIIWDDNNCYYHISGEVPNLRDSGAGILLTWKAIEYAKNTLQVKTFDFEGSMLPNVAHIRSQFGAYAVPYNFIWKYQSSLYKMLDIIQRHI